MGPGAIDLHTDNLERQVLPRANARWPSRSAMLAHDAQCVAAGVTTVFDSLCLGYLGFEKDRICTFKEGVIDLEELTEARLLKADHVLHLRCELPAPDMLALLEPVADHPLVRMVSLMDHSPGVGQYQEIERYRALRRKEGHSEAAIDDIVAHQQAQRERLRAPNRHALLTRLAGLPVVLASHDDQTEADVAVSDLVQAGAVDALASDYVPASLIEAAFLCADRGWLTVPQAIALVTANPARMAGLRDRGRIATGLRADLVRVHRHGTTPVLRETWRAGRRVA